MRSYMRYTTIIALLLSLAALPAFGQVEAVMTSVSGKVELRPQGGSWQAASEGRTVAPGTTVSTGFGASAEIELGESTIRVEPLTRLTLEELVQQADNITTRAFMDVGSVNAEVETAEGLSNDFQIRSAEATAAVRGTVFEFDGQSVSVTEGLVSLQNQAGIGTVVAQNQQSTTTGTAPPSDPEETTTQQFDVSANTNPTAADEGEDEGTTVTDTREVDPNAPVTIDLEW